MAGAMQTYVRILEPKLSAELSPGLKYDGLRRLVEQFERLISGDGLDCFFLECLYRCISCCPDAFGSGQRHPSNP